MIENKSEFGIPSEIELSDFEKENGIKLPEDYRAFLLETNGGRPNPNRNERPDTIVPYFLGMHHGDYDASLYKHIDMFKDRLPFSTFPIATDPFGNLFIMSVHPESYGHIYFGIMKENRRIRMGNMLIIALLLHVLFMILEIICDRGCMLTI